ncbi:MAG: alginate O-acetyltransferase AlgX-related protein [Bacteroidales bacterium]
MTGNTSASVKWILFGIIAGLSILPPIQKAFRPFHSRPLDGYSEPNPYPQFAFSTLFDGTYLPLLSAHYDHSIGFHNELVRLHNQVDFSLFCFPNAKNVVVGKDGYLFEEQYIKASTGADFIGEKIVTARVRQFSVTQEWLKREKGILFMVLLLPDKGTYYPEYIPGRFGNTGVEKTNYKWYRRKLAEQHINFIDFNEWFRTLKDTCRYPLYPKTGIHWSSYGAYLAMDSLVRYLETAAGNKLPHPVITRNTASTCPKDRDDDVARAMNLVCNISSPPLTYPEITYSQPEEPHPFSVLFIGDSFYFSWARAGYIGQIFGNRDFWYYDHDVYYGNYQTGRLAANEDMKQMLSKQDAIIILQTNAGYGELGYYFVDRLFEKAGS